MAERMYRDREKGCMGGVCAGIARHFSIEIWLVRIIAVSLALFNFMLALLLYGVGWLFLEPLPRQGSKGNDMPKIKARVWQQGDNIPEVLRRVDAQLQALDKRVAQIEKTVTKKHFHLYREFRDL